MILDKCGFIEDGYTRTGYIAETEFHQAMEFTYRPMVRSEIVRCSEEIAKAANGPGGAAAGEKVVSEWLAKRITQWDLRDRGNQVVPLDAGRCGRVEAHLSARLFGIITGTDVSDAAPVKEDDELKNSAAG